MDDLKQLKNELTKFRKNIMISIFSGIILGKFNKKDFIQDFLIN